MSDGGARVARGAGPSRRTRIVVIGAVIVLILGAAGLAIALAAAGSSGESTGKIIVVAAENQYGSMARAIGGARVSVTSLLDNPNTDPHEFEASASTAVTVSSAQLVIKNGLGYDSWVDKLLSASPRSGRMVFSVGEYLGHERGDNPHVWFDPAGWSRAADVITADLGKLDAAGRNYFQQRKSAWLQSLRPVFAEVRAVRQLTNHQDVIATEPVYGYMIAALGARALGPDFQKAIMNGTDPAPQSVAQFEAALAHHRAHMLFYNSQVTDPTADNMRDTAMRDHVPVIGVTETQPTTMSFAQWQLSQLRAIQKAWK